MRLFALSLLILISAAAAAGQAPSLPLESFTRLPHIGTATISPSGAHVAYLRSDGTDTAVIVRDFDGGNELIAMTTDNRDFYFNWVRWANDDPLLVSIRRYRKRGRWFVSTRLFAINRDGSE